MSVTTIADIARKLREQLDWRGPTGKAARYVVLERVEAEVLRAFLIAGGELDPDDDKPKET